ncbi:hypothetical protein AB0B45_47120 [Nonomuraea sp. NPDC049152]|uniref:hypothetical protein n=1 Tax=Nonomuraea sp. NPDC049152 TaxID=3154350 RepID=UPI0033FC1297
MEFRTKHRAPLEFLIAGGFVVSVLSCAVIAPLFPGTASRVAAMAFLVSAYAMWGRSLVSALAAAAMAWMFLTGFLVNAIGLLTFSRADLVRLVALLGAGLLSGAWGRVRRARPRHPMRHRHRPVLARRLHQRGRAVPRT